MKNRMSISEYRSLPRRAKYGNQKATYNGITFDSKRERDRYCDLLLLQQGGQITDLRTQVPFEVVPKQTDERAAVYKADFVYTENGVLVAEDAKGYRTPEYILKRKLFKLRYPEYSFREV